jgi:hypothetical protein
MSGVTLARICCSLMIASLYSSGCFSSNLDWSSSVAGLLSATIRRQLVRLENALKNTSRGGALRAATRDRAHVGSLAEEVRD